jgi:hypothetical protein
VLYVEADLLQQSFRAFSDLYVCPSDYAKRQLKRRRIFNIKLNVGLGKVLKLVMFQDSAFGKE